jgi:ATP-dependent helicase HrpA
MNISGIHAIRELLPNCLRQDRLRIEDRLRRLIESREGAANAPRELEQLFETAKKSVALRHQRHENFPQVSYPENLPISVRRQDIISAIKAHQVVVIAGETGSGKTTQIPKMCLEAGLGVEAKIGCTQPRRVAALSISRRVAEELRVNWGKEVGCKIRFADQSSPETYIKFMTDGILLAETQGDPALTEYEALVIDEAHERSLNIDFLLGHLKGLLGRRPDLKLIITSATIDTEAFSKAFNDAPIVEVSGRVYPVEIRYEPHDPEAEESGDLTYIDAAVSAVERVMFETASGDILIFMPSERDIRETQDDLKGRYGSLAEIIPLFGRLTSGEQERAFAPCAKRKIIIATNIAETSLTIPGIRYVIDPGLARVSRYSPRSRTKRLPIEQIAQSSANQRAGRCGRVENGVCIRLYSEAEFLEWPKYTQPEIQRANLAEVILRMKAWRLGEIETFPFINPPQPQAITSGYQLLQELGALDQDRKLTSMGKDLARLPVDPAIGRMVLQSVRERSLEEVLVIGAGLSIQDPRERPLDKQEAADAAHRQFLDPDSDFLTLLKIWNAFHDKLDAFQTQNQMRKFCKANFLSYTRMREWRDVHAQLRESLKEVIRFQDKPREQAVREVSREKRNTAVLSDRDAIANYAGIHRAILTGLLSHIAHKEQRNQYKAARGQEVMVFPGSSLFDRGNTQPKSRQAPKGSEVKPKSHQPEWIVAGEIVETSKLFARTVAGINPAWIAEMGEHLCKRSYSEPRWDKQTGRVLVRERVSLFGLEIQERSVDFGRINPEEATEIFIRAALIEEDIETPQRFLEHNRRLRYKLEMWRTRSRGQQLPNTSEALYTFYSERIQGVSSVHDLNRVIREKMREEPNFLCAKETDLTGGIEVAWDEESFPESVKLAQEAVALEYAYAPGEEHDGVTVKLPFALAHRIQPGMLDWIVPGLRDEQVEFLLKSLPKSLRVPLMPISPKVKELVAQLKPTDDLEALRKLVQEKYGVVIPASTWTRDILPEYLRPRIEITGKDNRPISAGRDLNALKGGLEKHETPVEQKAWQAAVSRWEQYSLSAWTFGDLPEEIDVAQVGGVRLLAFPGLSLDEHGVHVKLFRKREDSERESSRGFARLVELALQKELGWVQKDLRALEKWKDSYRDFWTPEALMSEAFTHLKKYILDVPRSLLPLRKQMFVTALESSRARMPGLVPKFLDLLQLILKQRQEIMSHRTFPVAIANTKIQPLTSLKDINLSQPKPQARAGLPLVKEELDNLISKDFLQRVSWLRLQQFPRYLKALLIRAERAALNPAKDQEKARLTQPFSLALKSLQANPPPSPKAAERIDELRWMLEEYKISVFAQELGTAFPISAKRLEAQLASCSKDD